MNIRLYTGTQAAFLRSAIDWRNRAMLLRERLAGYRLDLGWRHKVCQSTQSAILSTDRRVADLFAAAREDRW